MPYEGDADLTGQYPHFIKGTSKNEDPDLILYQAHADRTMRYATRTTGGTFKKLSGNIALKNSLALNNFRVIRNPRRGPKYIAVGGCHYAKNHEAVTLSPELQHIKEYECREACWPDLPHPMIMDDAVFQPQHANGIYVFMGDKLGDWTPVISRPILSKFTKCEGWALGTLGTDSMPCLLYDKKNEKFRIYLRANIALGVRHVVYSESSDLIEWTTPKLINVSFDFHHDNFYFFEVVAYQDGFLAFVPYFRNDVLDEKGTRRYYDECVKLYYSSDGISWDQVVRLIEGTRSSGHMRFPHVISAEQLSNEEFRLYVHENFLTTQNHLREYYMKIEEVK